MSEMRDKELFDDYFDSIFKGANDLSPEAFDRVAKDTGLNFDGLLPANKKARILDIGCGCGHFLYYLKQKGYTEISGIDISPQQVDFCRKTIEAEVETGDAFDILGARPGTYDLISMMDVLEHFPKDKVVPMLRVVHNALKTDGTIAIVVPNMLCAISAALMYRDFTHECGFTETSLSQVMWMAGFREMRSIPMKSKGPSTLAQVVRVPLRWLVRSILSLVYRCEGYSAPRILTPRIMVAARKRR